MMDKDSLVKVLMQALSMVQGQSSDPSGMTGFEGLAVDDGSNSIVPWQEKTIDYSGGQDRPALVDKMWAKSSADQETQQGMGPVPAGNLETDSDIYLQTGGV